MVWLKENLSKNKLKAKFADANKCLNKFVEPTKLIIIQLLPLYSKSPLREKCPNTKYFLVCIFPYSDQKKLRIWILFTQCSCIIIIRNACWPKKDVISTKRIKTDQRSAFKNDALNALLTILMNGLKILNTGSMENDKTSSESKWEIKTIQQNTHDHRKSGMHKDGSYV